MERTEPVIGIYHKDCSGNDGQTAAAVLLRKFPHARVFPINHTYTEEEIAPILAAATSETSVYTIDIAVAIEQLLPRAKHVVTIDHHISRSEELKKLAADNQKFTYIFDNNKCGSSLAWSYFFPDEPIPRLIALVEDYDINNRQFVEDAENLHFVLDRLKDRPEIVLELLSSPIDALLTEGRAVAAYVHDAVRKFIAKTAPLMLHIHGHAIPAYNGLFFKNDIARIYLENNPDSTVIVYSIDGQMVTMSIRSEEGTPFPALDAATILGGGGHKHASGARIGLQKFFEMIRI